MGQATILLVDDDVLLRSSCATLLELSGHAVIQAGDGAEALRQLDAGARPELLVVDLEMPVMGGWELLAILRGAVDRRLVELPVVIVSALDLSERARAVYPTLRKPVPPQRLLEMVGQMLAVARSSFG